jgi:hypothetical protein
MPRYVRSRSADETTPPADVAQILHGVNISRAEALFAIPRGEMGRFLVIAGWMASVGRIPGKYASECVDRLSVVAECLSTPVCIAMRCILDTIYNIAKLGGDAHRHAVMRYFLRAAETTSTWLLDHEYCIRLANALSLDICVDPQHFTSLLGARLTPAAHLAEFIVNGISSDPDCAVAFCEEGCKLDLIMQGLGYEGRCDVIVCIMNALDTHFSRYGGELLRDVEMNTRAIIERGGCSPAECVALTAAIHAPHAVQMGELA